jgi:hypothetical protein
MKINKKKFALELLKKILSALHEKRFDDVIRLVDECSMNENELQEFIQGTVEANGCGRIDEYQEENICSIDEEEDDPFFVETYLTADEGYDLPLCLSLELEADEDGNVKSVLEIDAN